MGFGGRVRLLAERCSEDKACESASGCAAPGPAPRPAGDVGDVGDVGDRGDVGSEPRMEPDAVSILL